MIGLGRTGVAVARWLREQGMAVYASDAAEHPALEGDVSRLRTLGVSVELGGHDVNRVAGASAVVVSPGVPPSIEALDAARRRGVEIRAELDLALQVLDSCRSIVVTGTNGKTTTTALIRHVLDHAGVRAEAAGNIGRPLIDLANHAERPAWLVVEASSFQLHDSPNLTPTIGVVTNLAPDHLNRYRSLEEYYGDKRLLFRNATPDSHWILNHDDEEVRRLAEGVPGRREGWSLVRRAEAWYDGKRECLCFGDTPLAPRADFPLLGDHNIANGLAAALAARAAGVSDTVVGEALCRFRALPHRLEPVTEVNGCLWINDSKATNVASAAAGIRAMTRPFVWIGGGRPKDESFAPLAPLLATGCRAAVVYGEAAPQLHEALNAAVAVQCVATLPDAVRAAHALTTTGDAVLLSPACASFDQFDNYEQRGDRFRDLAREL